MESSRALTAAEKRQLMDLARAVPETLLLVGTTETVFGSIKAARALLGEDMWGFDIADLPEPPPISAGAVLDDGGRGVGGVPLNATCGILAGIRFDERPPAPDFSFSDDLQNDDPALDYPFSAGFQYDATFHLDLPPALPDDHAAFVLDLLPELRDDDAAPAADLSSVLQGGDATSGRDYWANLLASALAADGLLPMIYREITRLISLHSGAGRVFFLCATRLGIQPGGAHDPGGQPDGDVAWKRWRDLRQSFVRHAHDALLRLKDAASAVAAAEDFIRWRSLESPGRNEWSAAGRQLVRDARRSLDETKESVGLMHDAAVREYFESWMILNRVRLEC